MRAGAVRVRLPGRSGSIPLVEAADVPMGAVLDARRGEVSLTTALDRRGHVQTAAFSGGTFEMRQSGTSRGLVDIHLRGVSRRGCPTRGATRSSIATASARKKKKRVVRRLWGRDRGGRYRTHGEDSVATVRGTRWLTEVRCDGTLTRVTEGAVAVAPKGSRRVRAGHEYLAPRKR